MVGGGGGTFINFRASSTWGRSVKAQFGMGGGARKSGASKRKRLGMWSGPVEGRASDQSEKKGMRRGEAKARSKTASLRPGTWKIGCRPRGC